MSIYYGKTNSIISSGSGDAELNIAYGLIPPSDTTKLWVRIENKPTSVEITKDNITWDANTSVEVLSDNLENTNSNEIVRAGEYLYFIGGWNNSLTYNKISRYNLLTNTYEDNVITLPYGLTSMKAVTYGDFIYIFYGNTYVPENTTYYFQGRVIKYNWKNNTLYTWKDRAETAIEPPLFRGSFTPYRFGKQIILENGGYPYNATQYPSGGGNIISYMVSSNGSVTVPGNVYKIFNLEKDRFENSVTQTAANTANGLMNLNNLEVRFGGKWSTTEFGISIQPLTVYKNIINEDTLVFADQPSYTPSNLTLKGNLNILLNTNYGLYVFGGSQSTTTSASTASTNIYYLDYATRTWTLKGTDSNLGVNWVACQYNEQTSYGRNRTKLIKCENKILLEENKLLIIPDSDYDDKYILGTIEDINLETSIKNIYIGDSNGKAQEVRFYKYENEKWVGINCSDYIEPTKKNLSFGCQTLEATTTVYTMGITCNIGDLIVASVVARSSGNETVSAGWELIGRSETGNLNQTLAFYKKIATATFEEITVTQASSLRVYISLVNFPGKTTTTLGQWSFNSNAIRGNITLPNKLCVVSASSNLWKSNQPYGYWSYTDVDGNTVENAIPIWRSPYFQQRLGTWVDDSSGIRTLTAPVDGGTDNTIIIGYVEIDD